MKKVASLFKRNYGGTRLVYDEVVESSEWVINGEGYPTEKIDGTSCLYQTEILYKRYDRKVSKRAKRKKEDFQTEDFKLAPEEWIAAEGNPNFHTGHWPGWLPIGQQPEDKWHQEGLINTLAEMNSLADGTYELIGPKVQGNPYQLDKHLLHQHGQPLTIMLDILNAVPRTFTELKEWLTDHKIEGIVWHHDDGRMVKIKRCDFGLDWPPEA